MARLYWKMWIMVLAIVALAILATRPPAEEIEMLDRPPGCYTDGHRPR